MEQQTPRKSDESSSLPTADQQLFVGSLVSLTWQLLIVVVLPFVGGHYLDSRLDTEPLRTIVGLVVALALAGLTTYRAYQNLTGGLHKTKDITK